MERFDIDEFERSLENYRTGWNDIADPIAEIRRLRGENENKGFESHKKGGTKMNNKSLLNIQTICFDCAKANGFVMKDKAVGVWTDKCEVCRERKPCTNLHHDWRKKGESK